MLSYHEPTLVHKRRALFYSLCTCHRTLAYIGALTDERASAWLTQFRSVWKSEKGQRLCQCALDYEPVDFRLKMEWSRFLIQVGVLEACAVDPISRQKVNVIDHCLAVDLSDSCKVGAREIAVPSAMQRLR